MTELWNTFRRIYYPPVCTTYSLTGLTLIMYIHVLLLRGNRRMIQPPGLGRLVTCLATWYENVKCFIVGEERDCSLGTLAGLQWIHYPLSEWQLIWMWHLVTLIILQPFSHPFTNDPVIGCCIISYWMCY